LMCCAMAQLHHQENERRLSERTMLQCPLDVVGRWTWRSRRAAETMLLAARKRFPELPLTCNQILMRFLLEPMPQFSTWTDAILLDRLRQRARLRICTLSEILQFLPNGNTVNRGSLVYSAQPLLACKEGRYIELHVDGLSGDARCGIVLGVTLTQPGNWEGAPPADIQAVPNCVWGLPKARMSRFRMGTRLGYLVSWSGDLVLYIDGAESVELVRRCSETAPTSGWYWTSRMM